MGPRQLLVRTDRRGRSALPTWGACHLTVVAIIGHTASGKSEIAEAVARRFGAEILSVDSMQVYRDMDIGTAKPTPAVRREIPHHMIDLVDPEDEFSVREFQVAGRTVLDHAATEGRRVVIVGGSGLHYRSLVDPLEFAPTDSTVRDRLTATDPLVARERLLRLDPEAGAHVDLANPRRVARALEIHELTGDTPTRRARTSAASAVQGYEALVRHLAVGMDAGDEAHTRVERRWEGMLTAGLLDEVRGVAQRLSITAAQAVGYRDLVSVLNGADSLESASTKAVAATKALVKRQRTYFRRDPRIAWMPWQDDPENRISAVVDLIEKETSWTL